MFRFHVTTDFQPRTKNGQPPHRTIGVARTSSAHDHIAGVASRCKRSPSRKSPIAITTTGNVRTALTQKRRRMSTSSGFSSSSTVDGPGFERHPADGARSRLLPHDLRMHRADVFGARRGGFEDLRFQRHAALGTASRALLPDLGIHRAGVCGAR